MATTDLSPCREVTQEEVAHYKQFGWVQLKRFVDPLTLGGVSEPFFLDDGGHILKINDDQATIEVDRQRVGTRAEERDPWRELRHLSRPSRFVAEDNCEEGLDHVVTLCAECEGIGVYNSVLGFLG